MGAVKATHNVNSHWMQALCIRPFATSGGQFVLRLFMRSGGTKENLGSGCRLSGVSRVSRRLEGPVRTGD